MFDYKEQNQQALINLLKYFNGNKSQLATSLKVSRNVVSTWFLKGRIGRYGAMEADSNSKIPFTKEQLRSDIKNWSVYKPRKIIAK